MKERKNFILWKLETDDKRRQRKIPYSPLYDGKASTTNPDTWTTYENAMESLKTGKYDGIGYVLDEGIVFIDLDHCRTADGSLTPLAHNIIHHFNDTFVEISQSGEGIHIFALGTIPQAVKTKTVEMYMTKRYAALTGNAVYPLDLTEAQERIDILYAYCSRGRAKAKERKPLPQVELLLSEQDIIRKATASKNGEIFEDLLNGNWQGYGIGDGTQSSADLKFANALAFWCGCDETVMQNIFRQSGMYRNDRKMHLAIRKAVRDCHDVYSGRR